MSKIFHIYSLQVGSIDCGRKCHFEQPQGVGTLGSGEHWGQGVSQAGRRVCGEFKLQVHHFVFSRRPHEATGSIGIFLVYD